MQLWLVNPGEIPEEKRKKKIQWKRTKVPFFLEKGRKKKSTQKWQQITKLD